MDARSKKYNKNEERIVKPFLKWAGGKGQLLKEITIVCGDYRESTDFIAENTFVYFDPPYRPITDTASFTAYTENLFNDDAQIELAQFVNDMDKKGAKIVIRKEEPYDFFRNY